MTFCKILFFVAFVAIIGSTQISPVHSGDSLKDLAKACRSKVDITDEKFEAFFETEVPTTKEEKCLLACIYKATGVMGDDGLISSEGAHAYALNKYQNDADKQTLLMKTIKACEKVNSEEVSDGTEGCERATLNLQCLFKENKDIVTGLE